MLHNSHAACVKEKHLTNKADNFFLVSIKSECRIHIQSIYSNTKNDTPNNQIKRPHY